MGFKVRKKPIVLLSTLLDVNPKRKPSCRECGKVTTVLKEDWWDYDFGHGHGGPVYYSVSCSFCGYKEVVQAFSDYGLRKRI